MSLFVAIESYILIVNMAQRYKNTPTIADAKTRKHAFQTIINDYRSLIRSLI